MEPPSGARGEDGPRDGPDAGGESETQEGPNTGAEDETRVGTDARGELARRVRFSPVDALVHLGVVAALVAVYVSPIGFESLLFEPGESGVIDAYRSILGHADPAHLLGNVVGFLVLAPVALVLLGDVDRRRGYYAAFAANLAVVPPLSALLWVLAIELAPGQGLAVAGAGFSVVTAAFAGTLALALAVHARDRLVDAPPATAVVFGPLAVAGALLALASDASPVALAALALLGLLALAATGRALATTFAAGDPVAVSLSVVGHVTFLGGAVDLSATGATRAHAVGLSLGFGLASVAWGLERLIHRSKRG